VAIVLGRFYFKFRTRQYATQQRKLEQQVFEKTKELQVKNEILEKNNTINTRLISIISHDIITPLKFLSVTGKNLREKKQLMSEELQEDAISEMIITSQDLQLLSTNILNWIKYQNENRRMAKDNFNVHELVNRVVGVLHSFAKQKQVNMVNETDEGLLIQQYAEPLSVIIYNLVSNAINSSETGNIIISSYHKLDHVIIGVKDEGVGMSAEQVRNILSDNIIISPAKTDYRKGNGLGYLIIKDLVKMIGAELTIQSERGKGTTVLVKIPV
jgi:K+-sensing histidine kinase KdpD